MDQRKYERIKARLMQKKREAGDALRAMAHKPGNPLVSREYGRAMDCYQKAKQALERHYENQRDDTRKPKAETDAAPVCPRA
jgi:poly-beta-hydroxyalkanoate depolymerase